MSPTVRETAKWTSLSQGEDKGVTILTKEGRVFTLSFDQLVTACQINENRNDFLAQVGDLLDDLDKWLNANAGKIDRAYLSFAADGVHFVVVQKEPQYDRDLEKSLLKLDVEVARDPAYSLIRLETLCLPPANDDAIRSFVRPTGTLKRQVS